MTETLINDSGFKSWNGSHTTSEGIQVYQNDSKECKERKKKKR